MFMLRKGIQDIVNSIFQKKMLKRREELCLNASSDEKSYLMREPIKLHCTF
jgi:hypothetical protein